jgi:phage gpG-like protein
MAKVPLTQIGFELERRIQARLSRYSPDSPELKAALFRIAILIESQAKINIRRAGIIDTGRLVNSIRHEFYRDQDKVGVRVGSFGVPYAALHEFGGQFSDRQRRAMFASLRDRGKLGPKSVKVDKNVIEGNTFRGRPYLGPAVAAMKPRIIEILRGLLKK